MLPICTPNWLVNPPVPELNIPPATVRHDAGEFWPIPTEFPTKRFPFVVEAMLTGPFFTVMPEFAMTFNPSTVFRYICASANTGAQGVVDWHQTNPPG